MKQIQLIFSCEDTFRRDILHIRSQYPDFTVNFQIFYDKARRNDVKKLVRVLKTDYPEASFFGCSSYANIKEGTIESGTIEAVCTVFERKDTQLKILHYSFNNDTQNEVCNDVLRIVAENPWVKGIEMLITLRNMSATYFCDKLSDMRSDIAVFGGCAFNKNLNKKDVDIMSEEGEFIDEGAIFVLYGGKDLHIWTALISGWKPLGKKMKVTRAEGNHLYELDGEPAYDVYHKYLIIENDRYFYRNALEFPMFYKSSESNILRVPSECLEDGSLIMSSDMISGSTAQLSYADPQTILRTIFNEALRLADFAPEGILIFDCVSRTSFWEKEDVNIESKPFQLIANTAGFYTMGELHRTGHSINQHNVTLIIAGMREGEAGPSKRDLLKKNLSFPSDHISMMQRLANFIDVAYTELDDTNKKLEALNQRLSQLAMTDELTGAYNRREIHERINAEINASNHFSLIMLDLDLFKAINDNYGHDTGDKVLKEFTVIMKKAAEDMKISSITARWGGEEFMILLPFCTSDTAFELAEEIRRRYSAKDFGFSAKHTVSCGVTSFISGESIDTVCSRVDNALYFSKNNGRDQTNIK